MPTKVEVEKALEDPTVVLVLDDEGRKLAERPALPQATTVTLVWLASGDRGRPSACVATGADAQRQP